MKLSVQLDQKSLFKLSRTVFRAGRYLQRRLVDRLTSEREYAVWEMPDNPEVLKQFVGNLRAVFPPEILKETLLFINKENGGQCFVAAGFSEAFMPHVRPVLNQFVGVIQNFNLSPALLIAMSIQGIFDMESDLTPARLEAVCGSPQQQN